MMHCTLIGDHSVLADFSKSPNPLREIHGISKLLFANKPDWAGEIIPGLDSLIVQLKFSSENPSLVRKQAIEELEKLEREFSKQRNRKSQVHNKHRIQVCYHPDVALDLISIAKACKLSTEEVVRLHKESLYTADILGFMPGFTYFSGLNPKLRLPRLNSPRPSVPKGSVAIAELQTAIYPRATPGGWNIIGRSPNTLFDIQKNPPGLFMAGDQMEIEEISLDKFHELDHVQSAQEILRSAQANSINSARIEVLQAGTFSSIQDNPRENLSHWAVGPGGACDLDSLHLANALVGNLPETAAIEMTSTGPTLLFHEACCIAWVGATCEGIVDGQRIPGNRPVWLAKGSTLKFSSLHPGFRSMLAIGGGLALPHILGRAGSHISADIGPKRLEKGDVLLIGDAKAPLNSPFLKSLYTPGLLPSFPKWHIRSPFLPTESVTQIQCLPGPHLSFLQAKDQESFWSTVWSVSNQSNRMGVRLQSDFKLKKDLPHIPSQAITFGTVQFPPSQEPIVMLAEHQTTGGYPRLAEVIRADLVKLAQLKPGSKIQLKPVNLEEADSMNAKALKLQDTTMNSIQTMIQTTGKV